MTDTTVNVEDQVLTQVEFYFSDSNLPKDKFLQGCMKKDPNQYVPIETLTRFKRLAALTTDQEVIANAVRKSEKLLQLSEDGKSVRRNPDLPLPTPEIIAARTAVLRDLSTGESDATIDSVRHFVSSTYGSAEVLSVRLRRTWDTRVYKGSAFIEFGTAEEAARVVAAHIAGGKSAEMAVDRQARKDKAAAERREAKAKAKAKAKAASDASDPSAAPAGDDGGDKKNDDGGDAEKNDDSAASGKREREDGGDDGNDASKKPRLEKEPEIVEGVLVKFAFADGTAANVDREGLKAAFEEHAGDVRFVKYSRGMDAGKIRFAAAESVDKAIAAHKEKPISVGGVEIVSLGHLTEEEEAEFWEETKQKRSNPHRKGGRGGGRGGRWNKPRGGRRRN